MKIATRYWRRVDRVGAALLGLLPLVALTLPFVDAPPARHERLVLTAFGIGVYLATFALACLLFGRGLQQRHRASYGFGLRRAVGWVCRWHGMVTLALLAGALFGAIIYTGGGLLLERPGGVADFALAGARDGAFYILIWAPGAAIVACFILAFGPGRKSPPGGR